MPWTSTKSWAATADSGKPGSRTTGSEPCSTPASPTGASSPSSASAGIASCPRSPYGGLVEADRPNDITIAAQ
jgi:hypothetical protein